MDWLTVWRSVNVGLSAVSLYLLIADVWHRRRLHLRARFYWEAVALMLFSTGWGSADAIFHPRPAEEFSPVRIVIVTLALIYFLISIVRVRRFNRREEETAIGGS